MVGFIRNGYLLVLIMMLIGIGLLTACHQVKQLDIAGTYVNSGRSEFSIAHDTLVISLAEQSGHYLVSRTTGISLIAEDGEIGKEVLEKENWHAEYDRESAVLIERNKGRRMTIGPVSLQLERAEYRRLP